MRPSALLHKLDRFLGKEKNAGKIERGAIFVVVILTILIFTAFMFVGGNIPTKLPLLNTTNLVSVEGPKNEPAKNSLQLYTFQGVTLTPYPSLQTAPAVPTIAASPVACGTTLSGAKQSIIWAYRIAQTAASNNQPSFQLFYNDGFAMPLGTREMAQHPADHIANPPINVNNKDANGFTLSPAVYLTDITANAADTSGDAKSGGSPQPPTDVYGAWKIENGVQPNSENGVLLGPGADPWPAANGPGGGNDQTWTAEVIWNLANLRTKAGQALVAGNKYRLQAAIHNGNGNGDVAEICITFTMP